MSSLDNEVMSGGETGEVVGESFRVAIIGRPNVGKSTLFNILTRSRKAVVKNQPGVTRDIQSEMADWWGKSFEVLDTGGLTNKMDDFSPLIFQQVLAALGNVHLLVVVLDGKSGLLPEDRDIIRVAKESGRPFFVVINKVDREHEADLIRSEFYELGVDFLHASFENHAHVDEIVEKIRSAIPEDFKTTRTGIRFAIVGKPNVGKSSLANNILGEHRMIVSDIAGTTVDAVQETFKYNDQKFVLVDTAGLRRQGKRMSGGNDVEILSAYKSFEAIDKAEVVILVVDATLGPSEQDARLATYAYEKGKGLILVGNKTDLARNQIDQYKQWFRDKMEFEFHFGLDVPIMFTSALTGEGVDQLLDKVIEVSKKLAFKISTSDLNNFFYKAIRGAPSPVYRNANVKFYYLTQTEQKPPSFLAFANHPEGVTPSYKRFLINRIQDEWKLQGIPVRIYVMKSGSGD
jgi:GTPase